MIKLDYSLQSPEERKALVESYLEENPDTPAPYLEILADYLVLCMEKQERKEKNILTENRLTTVNKRETSFENLAAQFENGEDGVYSLITEDKNTIFYPKISITPHDIETIPELRQVREGIAKWEQYLASGKAVGKSIYIAKRAIIDLRKDQYIIKEAFTKPVRATPSPSMRAYVSLDRVDLKDPKACSAILCNYSALKQNCYDNFFSDTYYLMESFDAVSYRALAANPYLLRLLELKIDGLTNSAIRQILQEELGIDHTEEYVSKSWRKTIPALIASQAEDEYLNWHYLEEEPGVYKRCRRCGQTKLAISKYFSINNASKDGLYSICRACRASSGQNQSNS